jgi:HAD superfamily hydrolase (TIGR01484 family)
MSSSHYQSELQQLGATYKSASQADVTALMKAVAGASQASVIGIGSGGSFTVASLLCNLHETFTGRVSRPSTPLEIIWNPTLASTSPAFFISAEGKNPDIVEALHRARLHSARAIHVLTNRSSSPLCEEVSKFTDVGQHVFELTEKDGFLATNSLLMDAVLIARAYEQLSRSAELPSTLEDLALETGTIDDWIKGLHDFASMVVSRRGLIVVYAPSLRAVATDLESKLAESALLHAQIADLRSFAHGRHLWLAHRPADCAILALIDPTLSDLWAHTRTLIPEGIPCAELRIRDSSPRNLIAALVAELHLVGLLADRGAHDAGRPIVPQFGRDLYYADLTKLVKMPDGPREGGVSEKFETIGARWPYVINRGPMQRSRDAYRESLEAQVFRAIVFDYDGTLCGSQKRNAPPSKDISKKLNELTAGGVRVAIVSGRGGSMREELRKAIPRTEWPKIRLGLYNGGLLTSLDADDTAPEKTSEFLSHVTRIVRGLWSAGMPVERLSPTPPYQISIQFHEGVDTEAMWFVVADALRHAGLDLGSIVRSRHSIDVLAPTISKTRVLARLIQEYDVLPQELLTIGDQGAWPGNDFALLEHRCSLSVDFSSRRLDRGWKLAPPHKRGVDAAHWYLDRIVFGASGSFTLRLDDAAV